MIPSPTWELFKNKSAETKLRLSRMFRSMMNTAFMLSYMEAIPNYLLAIDQMELQILLHFDIV